MASTAPLVIAVTYWGSPPEDEAQQLAPYFGLAAYDVRMKLVGPLPVIITVTSDEALAQELIGMLRGRGHGAVVCDCSRIAASAAMIRPRDFALAEGSLLALGPPYGQQELPFGEIVALIRAMHASQDVETTVTHGRKFSASRALITGGAMVTKGTTKTSHSVAEVREQALYVFRSTGADPFLLLESSLQYSRLGPYRRPTRGENFNVTVDYLKGAAPPGTVFDDSLVSQRPRSTVTGLGGPMRQALLMESNVGATDVAAHLLAVAHLQGQAGPTQRGAGGNPYR